MSERLLAVLSTVQTRWRRPADAIRDRDVFRDVAAELGVAAPRCAHCGLDVDVVPETPNNSVKPLWLCRDVAACVLRPAVRQLSISSRERGSAE